MYARILLLLALLGAYSVQAQNACPKSRNAEAVKLLERGKSAMRSAPERALRDFTAALELDGTYGEAHFYTATINEQLFYQKEKQQTTTAELLGLQQRTEKHYRLAIKFCPQGNNYGAQLQLGQFLYHQKKRPEAREMLLAAQAATGENAQEARRLMEAIDTYTYLMNNPVKFDPTLVQPVSTTDDEYLPLVSPDGQFMFFTRRSPRQVRAGNVLLDEVFMFSKRDKAVDFGPGKFMPLPFNDGRNMGGATITIDNKTMFVTICTNVYYGQTAYKNCDIYETVFREGQWTRPVALDEAVNGKHTFEAQPTVTADGNTLYFVSIRDGGIGKMDIYRSTRDVQGRWSPAENLGPTINTLEDDKTPFIHTDGSTLYFASTGHPGLGGFDIYYSRSSGGDWTRPKNIGYPINTEEDNLGMVLSSDGRHLFFSSRHLSKDEQFDIFTSELYEEARPEKILFLRGSIDDERGADLTGASVHIENLKTTKRTPGLVDETTGEYAVAVARKKNEDYMLVVEKEQHMFRSHYIDPQDPRFDSVARIDFSVPRIKKGMTVELENIYFEFNSSQFNYKSDVTLRTFLGFMQKNPEVRVKIMGHTDNVGSDDYNLQLSAQRAKAVHDYLLKHGIAASRLQFQGFGKNKPIAPNDTEVGRAKNRRTEFEIF